MEQPAASRLRSTRRSAGTGRPADADSGPTSGCSGTQTAPRQTRARKRTGAGIFVQGSLEQAEPVPTPGSDGVVTDTTNPAADAPEQTDSASGGRAANDSGAVSPPEAAGSGTSDANNPSTAAAADRPDCGICLETCLHPVKLPCGHVFCFLCIKGATKQDARCSYCRADVPERFIKKPKLLDESEVEREMSSSDQQVHWLYQGRNGWWQYDERTSRDIEEAFSEQQSSVQIQVAGELYTIDLVAMTQYHAQCRGRRRRIRRQSPTSAAASGRLKGVAGLRTGRPRRH